MLRTSKTILFFSMIVISIISIVNITIMYWFPMQIPLSSYLAIALMSIAYFFKAYYLIPLCYSICILMFFAAFSFRKEQVAMPLLLLAYLLCDFFFLAYTFFDSWINDAHLVAVQAIQLIVSVTIISLTFIYLVTRKAAAKQG